MHVVLAGAVGLLLLLAACSDDSESGSSAGTAASAPETTASDEWAAIDQGLASLAPKVGFLAARVSPDGTCEAIHEIDSSTPRPIGSQFKLFVLGALANQIRGGQVSWDQTLTVDDSVKSLGNGEGSLQAAPPGTSVTVEEAATKMISISDNTAADMLIGLVGRDAIDAQVSEWVDDPSDNQPFLTTREVFLLHYVPGLGDRYLATPQAERDAFVTASVDPVPPAEMAAGVTAQPRYVEDIEWFATPQDICRAFAGLQQLSTDPVLSPMNTILSVEDGSADLDPAAWPMVWFKGGSEPGVLTLGWSATNRAGETFVVEGMLTNPDAPLAPDAITDLVGLGQRAFELLGQG